MSASLVGSEMCIRDSPPAPASTRQHPPAPASTGNSVAPKGSTTMVQYAPCLLYTSDAADDM
eukprot:3596705-Alexandrium_andersonii.AAC.1